MAKKAKKRATRRSSDHVLVHPGMTAMMGRVASCNKPPIQWHRMHDGSWMECFLLSDCTYGNCVPVGEGEVPAEVRSRFPR